MRRVRGLIVRLLAPFFGSRSDGDFDAELESHLQLHIDDNIRAGLTPEEARRQALLALGGVERTKDDLRDQRGFPMLDAVVRDSRYAVRLLVKSPGFTLAAILILGLGIGANAAIFSVVNSVILRPLPFPDSARLVRVWHVPPREQFSGMSTFAVSPANYLDWQAQSTSFEHMSIYGFRRVNITGQGEPDALTGRAVSGDFFSVLGIPARLGRTIGPDDDAAGREHVVVLSERIWRTRFGADPSIVGRSISLNSEPYAVVGVLAQRTAFPDDADIWLPLALTPEQRAVRGNHNYLVIARLKRDVDLRRAQADLTAISKRLEQQYPVDDKGWGAVVLPLQQALVGDVKRPLLVLLGAVACVLLIACANLANLLLARVLGRGREIAIRAAVGASRARIVQQLLVESALLGLAGGAVGLLAAKNGVGLVVAAFGQDLPRAGEINVDGRVLAFTFVVALLTGLVAGVAPAWRMTKGDVNEALKQGVGRIGAQTGERRVRNVLVVAEVALALVLLVGAGLLIRTLWQLRAVDPGFDPNNLMTMTVFVPQTTYSKPERLREFFDDALRRIRTLPGVESAATVDSLPLQGGSVQPIAVQGRPTVPLSEQPEVAVRVISTGYVRTVRMRVVEGRDITEADAPNRPLTVLVSAALARRFWPNETPVGKRLILGLISNDVREVVGVVSDVKLDGLDARDPTPVVYVPFSQVPSPYEALVVRTTVPPTSVVSAVIGAVHQVDPEQPVLDVMPMDEVIGASIAQQRFAMRLLTTFAAFALLLAAIGIYGVLSYTVRQRVQEIGVRMALGAATRDVVGMIVVEGLKPTLVGLTIGLAAAAALGRVLATLVFGVTPRDAATFAAVSVVVLAVGVLASLIPAWRATQVDPLQALRAE